MKILVTGGSGFIGSHLIRLLLNLNYSVIALKRKKSNIADLIKYKNKIIFYNFEEKNIYDKIFTKNKIDVVIHLAGNYLKKEPNNIEAKRIADFNIVESLLLLKAAVKHGVKGFINTGSFFEFKPSSKKLNEDSEKIPFNYYAATKMAFEDILISYAKSKKIRAVTLRLFSPYGEGQENKIIPLIINSLLSKKTLFLTKGKQELSFTYIEDILDAYIKAIKYILSSKYKNYQDFNIGANKCYSIIRIINKLKKISGKSTRINFGAISYYDNDFIHVKCDSSKAKKVLRWQAKTNIDEGLLKTYKYFSTLSII